jgi:hypothetical protein
MQTAVQVQDPMNANISASARRMSDSMTSRSKSLAMNMKAANYENNEIST